MSSGAMYSVATWYRIPEVSYNNTNERIRCEVFTAVTIENVVFWDIKTKFVLHRKYIPSPLQSSVR
jgi:hypothetical protein